MLDPTYPDTYPCPTCSGRGYIGKLPFIRCETCDATGALGALEVLDALGAGSGKHAAIIKAAAAECRALHDAASELLEVADLRGDTELPHPADDQANWTARMQDAWNVLRDLAPAVKP